MQENTINDIAKLAVSASELANAHGSIVIPDGYKLQSLEHLKTRPYLFRGLFSTTMLNEFADYVIKHGTENTTVFIDNQKIAAQAIIDMGSHDEPHWGKHRAEVTLLKTPAFAKLLENNNRLFSQQEFIDFCEDWKDHIGFYYTDETFLGKEPFEAHIKTLRRIKVNANLSNEQTVNQYSSSKSAMESIEIKAGQEDTPPTGFVFTAQAYDAIEQITFNCQIRVVFDDKIIKFKYRITQLDAINERIAGEFREKLQSTIINADKNISINIGTMKYQ